MAYFKKYTSSAVYNELQHNVIRIGNNSKSYNLAPHRDLSDYEYFEQRKSELYCLDRADVKVLISWTFTAPRDLNPSIEADFFKLVYQFLENRYGSKNVIQAYVTDRLETGKEDTIGRPYLRFYFIPVAADTNPNHFQEEKICANDVLGPDLYRLNSDLHQYLSEHGMTGITPRNGKTFCSFFDFSKSMKKTADIQADVSNLVNEKKSLLCLAESISEILQIDCPKIEYVDCIFDTPKGVCSANVSDLGYIPPTDIYIGAFYNTHNIIFIARKFFVFTGKNRVQFNDFQFNDQAFLLAHELRHVWQQKYHYDMYYAHNARGVDVLDDIAEIDADTFALLFLFSEFAPDIHLQAENLSINFCNVFAQVKLDDNARIDRAKELSKEYTWGNWKKLADFSTKVRIENFERYQEILRNRRLK